MLLIVLLVVFIMTMFIWLLSLLGAASVGASSAWLAFFACAILGIVVFAISGGATIKRP